MMDRANQDPLLQELIDTLTDATACANKGTQSRLLHTMGRIKSRYDLEGQSTQNSGDNAE